MQDSMILRSVFVSLLILPLFLAPAWGQEAGNVNFAQSTDASNKIYTITYDLLAPYDNIACQVQVKFTSSEGSFNLKKVTGDVGDLVYPGPKKTIIWNYVDELVHFSGDINLSIEVVPIVQVPASVRRSKHLSVVVSNVVGTAENYNTKLFLKTKEVATLASVGSESKSVGILIPKRTPVKKNYQIAIANGDKVFFSNTFKVRPKIGYGWKAGVLLAIPAFFIINKAIEDNKPLPGPPSHN
ncbi:MAG TPA: hypothetical protein VF141_08935 [Chryseolinea sp.]